MALFRSPGDGLLRWRRPQAPGTNRVDGVAAVELYKQFSNRLGGGRTIRSSKPVKNLRVVLIDLVDALGEFDGNVWNSCHAF